MSPSNRRTSRSKSARSALLMPMSWWLQVSSQGGGSCCWGDESPPPMDLGRSAVPPLMISEPAPSSAAAVARARAAWRSWRACSRCSRSNRSVLWDRVTRDTYWTGTHGPNYLISFLKLTSSNLESVLNWIRAKWASILKLMCTHLF